MLFYLHVSPVYLQVCTGWQDDSVEFLRFEQLSQPRTSDIHPSGARKWG